jgi:uncharacterized damage-inducible protein DinB
MGRKSLGVPGGPDAVRGIISARNLGRPMLPNEVSEFFEYLIETRRRFLDRLRGVVWEEMTKDRRASWGSMLAVFLHLLDDEEGWWQIALEGGSLAEVPDRNRSIARRSTVSRRTIPESES